MRKKCARLVILLLTVTLFYLVVQLYLYNDVSHRREKQDVKDIFMKETERKTLIAKENIELFVKSCMEQDVTVTLVDPSILRLIVNRNQTKWLMCQYLCTDDPVTTFSVYSTDWKNQVASNLVKTKYGFRFHHLEDLDPRMESLETYPTSYITTHYFFTRKGHTIHLVFMYRRNTQFIWHSAATPQQLKKTAVAIEQLKYGKFAGAYDWFDSVPVVIDNITLHLPRFPKQFLQQYSDSRFTECNFTRARKFYHQYPRENSDDARFFREEARDIIRRGKRYLDQIGVPFWLSSGTCLGWFRQCDIIPYSKDVDFGIWVKNYKDSLIPVFEGNSMGLIHRFGKVSDSLELSFRDGDVKLDMFFFYEESDYMWNGGTQARTGNKYKYIFPKFTMCWTFFLGMKLRVPCETESYIEANYGKKWFVPVKLWDWKNSPPNVRENGQWPKDQWKEVIQLID